MSDPSPSISIDDLVSQALAGQSDAEEVLFRRLHARILSLAKRRVWDDEAARDLAQETALTVFEKYRQADLSHGFLPWVFTILHHKVGNYLRRRRTEIKHRVPGPALLEWSTTGVNAADETGVLDFMDIIEKALRGASPQCQEVFRLLLDGASRQEIHRAIGGVRIGTTDSRISRCRERLLRALEDLNREDRKP